MNQAKCAILWLGFTICREPSAGLCLADDCRYRAEPPRWKSLDAPQIRGKRDLVRGQGVHEVKPWFHSKVAGKMFSPI